ncbi:MAG: arginase family protein [Bacteroidales bacterium]|jgi:arginase family enzyme|nr:arginase family protein [Bacteroidales bacterium]NLH23857.1 arginase family protein [Bacteroidales bacterium]
MSEIMNIPVIIMDFTRVYRSQFFYIGYNHAFVDCTDIPGTDCYCDQDAEKTIKARIALHPLRAVHFLDTGNHHYITKFWTDRIDRDFMLVVADHHHDMQPPLFEDLLSCGGWVRTVLDTNPFLKQLLFIGVSEEYPLVGSDGRIFRYPAMPGSSLPVYISIDKDILHPRVVTTNWDQGSMSFRQLQSIIKEVMLRYRVLGVDICGECTFCIDNRSDLINGRLLSCIASGYQAT